MRTLIKKDICIVGSGFCGYTAYKNLKDKNIDLILIEGGNYKTPNNSEEQKFYSVKNNKFVSNIKLGNKIFNINNSLDASYRDRRYTLGGSAEAWSGWIKPFEKSTYENKFEEFSNQSWQNNNLSRFDKESLELLNSPILDFDPNKVAFALNFDLPELPDGLYYTVYSWAKSPLRLKNYWSDKATSDLEKLNNNQNVLYSFRLIDLKIKDKKVNSLIFEGKDKSLLEVEANTFIIALGGIENTRFTNILNSKDKLKKYPKELVGNFQEHPHLYDMAKFNFSERQIPDILKSRIPILTNENILKGKVKIFIAAWDGIGTPKVTFEIKQPQNKFKSWIKSKLKNETYYDCHVHLRCEQSPKLGSKINFDKNNTKLNWEVKDTDFKFYSDYLKRFGTYMKSMNYLKDFKISNSSYANYTFPKQAYGGAHHMGTVPLTIDNSILNRNFSHCKYKNTYIVGSSSFPTSGFENPTHCAISTTLAALEDIKKNI
tara:strand:- start:56 stop:1516 length:1461 start_codon:yes stop_codon:yes gene_type:complete